MIYHNSILEIAELRKLILSGEVKWGGNLKLKIYGTLSCASGKRMKKENRVFFKDEMEAISRGFRPCGHCLRKKYKQWTNNDIAGQVPASFSKLK